MKTNTITVKTVFYLGILPMVKGLFLFFIGHKLLGILILTAIILIIAVAT